MLTRLLQKARLSFRGTFLGGLLRRLGVTSVGRVLYERRILQRGYHESTVLDSRFKFAVLGSQDITRIDHFAAEEMMATRMLQSLQTDDVWLDVGANVGMLSLLLESHGASVHAFEPECRARDLLRRNLELNRADRVTIHPVALGDRDRIARFYVDDEPGSGGHSLLAEHCPGAKAQEVKVRCAATLLDELAILPDAVKVDVEGAEMEVLRGLAPKFEHGTIRELFCELHPRALESQGVAVADITSMMENYGYGLIWSSRPRSSNLHHHYVRHHVAGSSL